MNNPDPILQVPDERLRGVCAPVETRDFGGQRLRSWIERLDVARRLFVSIGIAAPQIGLMHRLILIEIPSKDWLVFGPVEPVALHALANPEIVWSSDDSVKAVETCLSIRGYQGFVSRPRRIGVAAFTPQGEKTEFEADGLYGRVLQHEIDHLNGVLYPDHITSIGDISKIQAVEADDLVLACNRHHLAEP